ncbi:MAG: hypothetical protein AAB618_02090, partial [Patescibacteria group bacterium]
MPSWSEKLSFLKKHEDEVLPLVSDEETKDALTSLDVTESQIEDTLEQYETKVFNFENENVTDGVRIMLEASQPASRTAVEQLLATLSHDDQCKAITLLTDNIAGSTFAESHPEFSPERTEDDLLLSDITDTPDTCLVFAEEPKNSPAPLLLHSAKSIFGAKKLYVYISDQHVDARLASIFNKDKRETMDDIDAFLVSDDKTKVEVALTLNIPPENILVVGDPAIDKIYQEDKEQFRSEGRRLLGLPEGTTALLYSGFPSADYKHLMDNPELNLQTFSKTLEGMRLTAQESTDRLFALVVRAHPRDSQKEKLMGLLSEPVPPNLRLIDGGSVVYQHAIYATDGIICMASSTEHYMGKYRGRKVFIVAYDGEAGSSLQHCHCDPL